MKSSTELTIELGERDPEIWNRRKQLDDPEAMVVIGHVTRESSQREHLARDRDQL